MSLFADRISGDQLRHRLAAYDITIPTPADLAKIENILMSGCSAKLSKYLCRPKLKSNRVLNKELKQVQADLKLTEYFDTSKEDFYRAHYLFAHPDVRLVIEVFLMTIMPLEDISTLLRYKFQLEVPVTILKVFRKYFYNTKIMDGPSWQFYMARRLSHECRLKNLALRDPENVPRIKWQMGFRVDIPFVEQARKLMTDSFFNLSDLISSPSKDADKIGVMKSVWQTAGDRFVKLNVDEAEAEANRAVVTLKARDTRKELEAPKMITGALPEIKKDDAKGKIINMPVQKKPDSKASAKE